MGLSVTKWRKAAYLPGTPTLECYLSEKYTYFYFLRVLKYWNWFVKAACITLTYIV